MTIIGITGPTGAGKTTALAVLRQLGFDIVDCDALYYQRLREDRGLRQALTDAFGPVFLPDGELDRRALAKRVFGDQQELERLNAIVYPAMCAAVKQKIQKCSQKGLAIDAINLVESGLGELCDLTVAVTAAPPIRLARIMARDGLSEEQARARITAQKPDVFYQEHCTYLVENRGEDQAEFEALIRDFFEKLLKISNGGVENYGNEGIERDTPGKEEERL